MNLIDPHRLAPQPRRDVAVRVGGVRPSRESAEATSIVVVGIAPAGTPWLADVLPHAVVRDTRFRDRASAAVEHMRIRSRDDLEVLPGLTNRAGSRVRDAVRLCFQAGAPQLDLLLARVPGLGCTELAHDEVRAVIDPLLSHLLGAVLLFPDLGRAPRRGPAGVEQHTWGRAVRAWSSTWPDRFQVALLDAPDCADAPDRAWQEIVGVDAALCTWEGPARALVTHGWRSAAAAVAPLLCTDLAATGASLVGRRIPLAQGRRVAPDRLRELGGDTGRDAARSVGPLVRLALGERDDEATLRAEPSLRSPAGAWPLPCLRLVKQIHRQIVATCERFVFHTVDEGRATALAVAIEHALDPLVERGLLVGPNQEGPPEIEGWPERSAAAPALRAELGGWLRPWATSMNLRVTVRPGHAPEVEFA